jgi:hypothetical protein
MQLDLFVKDEVALLHEELHKVKTSSDNVRRGIFQRHDELAKKWLQLYQEVELLKQIVKSDKRPAQMFSFCEEKVS